MIKEMKVLLDVLADPETVSGLLPTPIWTVLIAAGLAFVYQRWNKRMEFRYEVYKKACVLYPHINSAAWMYRQLLIDQRVFKGDGSPALDSAAARLDELFMEGMGIGSLHQALFSKKVQRLWLAMLDVVKDARFSDDIESAIKLLRLVTPRFEQYQAAAAREIPLRHQTSLVDASELHKVQTALDAGIDRLRSARGKADQDPGNESSGGTDGTL